MLFISRGQRENYSHTPSIFEDFTLKISAETPEISAEIPEISAEIPEIFRGKFGNKVEFSALTKDY